MNPDDIAKVEAALREGITDAYRHGIGAAIRTIEIYREHVRDKSVFDAMIAALRHQSASCGIDK